MNNCVYDYESESVYVRKVNLKCIWIYCGCAADIQIRECVGRGLGRGTRNLGLRQPRAHKSKGKRKFGVKFPDRQTTPAFESLSLTLNSYQFFFMPILTSLKATVYKPLEGTIVQCWVNILLSCSAADFVSPTPPPSVASLPLRIAQSISNQRPSRTARTSRTVRVRRQPEAEMNPLHVSQSR
jgi:hypothetical protein